MSQIYGGMHSCDGPWQINSGFLNNPQSRLCEAERDQSSLSAGSELTQYVKIFHKTAEIKYLSVVNFHQNSTYLIILMSPFL